MNKAIAHNPIKSGFYPDPSICRVNEDFYLVNSTFAYFPGVAISHSKDLANWEQIGSVLDRNSQLPLQNCGFSRGIYAPTIRYYDGIFYMITTNISAAESLEDSSIAGGNFVVTATNPAGPWSEPYYLGEAAQGIDPSLFFDKDGSCYYCGTRPNHTGVKYNGDWEIWVQQLDLSTMKLTGDSTVIWTGAMKNVIWPEGPHLYHMNGYYYVMHAEGGTGPDHCVAIARSENILGPYTGYPSNPILTHRHLGKAYPIRYVGHGDLVNVPASMTISGKEKWYMVCLASRPCEGYTLMGRETFLAEVTWEDDWPVVNPSVGMLTKNLEIDLPEYKVTENPVKYTFEDEKLPMQMLTLHNREEGLYSLSDRAGFLRIPLTTVSLQDLKTPAFVGVRQTAFYYDAGCEFEFTPSKDGECAGMVIMQSNQFHLKLQVRRKNGYAYAQIIMVEGLDQTGAFNGIVKDTELTESVLQEKELGLICDIAGYTINIHVTGLCLSSEFEVLWKDKTRTNGRFNLAENIDIRKLSSEVAGGFVGNVIGIFTYAEEKTDAFADFKWFMLQDKQ